MIEPVKGFKYDVVEMRNGVSLGVLETLEYNDGVDFEEWLAIVCLAAHAYIADEDSNCDEVVVVMRTMEDRGYYHGIVVCNISS